MDPLFLVSWRVQGHARRLWKRMFPNPLPESFLNTKSIFIHVPKSAGVSITTALYGHEVGHRTVKEFESDYPGAFARFFKFGFVRNPWDRIVSAYAFLYRGGMHRYAEDQRFGRFLRTKHPDFEHFVLDWLDERTSQLYVHFVPQVDFLLRQDGEIGVDFLGRFESIDRDFAQVAARVNTSAALRHLNSSTQIDYRTLYPRPDLVDRVAEVYARDVELFGYTFE